MREQVESATRPDGARRGNRDFYERLHAGQEERSVAFERAQALLDGAGLSTSMENQIQD